MSMAESYQLLAPWLSASFDRANRIYLETHLELLNEPVLEFLECFVPQFDDEPELRELLKVRLQLLREVKARGSTVQAVREAYVNRYGGLLLDLPAWLLEIEQTLRTSERACWTERQITARKLQLSCALAQLRMEQAFSPVIMAELQFIMAGLFLFDAYQPSSYDLQVAIRYYEEALQVYTIERYPLQHIKTLVALGQAYTRFPTITGLDHLVKALDYYKKVLRLCEEGVSGLLPAGH